MELADKLIKLNEKFNLEIFKKNFLKIKNKRIKKFCIPFVYFSFPQEFPQKLQINFSFQTFR